MQDTLLKLESLCKDFGSTSVVKGINLEVKKGEFVSLLGASGCGKTTTLQMIAGFEKPTAGRIVLNGVDITNVAANKREIGIVFQNYALFPHMTVEENIEFGLVLRKTDKAAIKKRLDELLELVHLGGLEKRYPRELSGGQQQRVAIARALATRPNVLLLDEPFSNLDARLRGDMQNEVKRLQLETGITTILVTHDQSEAMSLSDRIAIMHKGVALQVDTPQAVYDHPANEYVGNFLGNNNILQVESARANGDLVTIERADARIDIPNPHKLKDQEFRVSIRPERVKLGAEAASCQVRLPARVQSCQYNGSYWHLDSASEFGKVSATLPHLGATVPRAGEDVVIGWNHSDMRLVHAD